MRRVILASALLLALCGNVFGNAGVFFGSGHTLRLVKSADVQMVSEDVTIRPMCGADPNHAPRRIPLRVRSKEFVE